MWIEILKTGDFIDSKGQNLSFNASQLDEIAETYNRKVRESSSYEAPLVKGHPTDNSPAFGWVEQLTRNHNFLLAKIKNLSKEIIEDINNKSFKKVSVSLYPDKMLRHIGLLGAAQPAVKGLENVELPDGIALIEFDSQFVLSDNSEFIENTNKTLTQIINENNNLIEDNKKLSALIEEASKKNKELNRIIMKSEFKEFADSITGENKFLPSNFSEEISDLLLETMEQNEKEPIKLKSFLCKLAALPLTNEIKLPTTSINSNDFSDENVSPERLTLHKKALEIQMRKPSLNYEEALNIAFTL